MRIFSRILAMRHEQVFIHLCPYCQTVTRTAASHNPNTGRNFYSPQWNSLRGQIDRDMEVMDGSWHFWILTQCT